MAAPTYIETPPSMNAAIGASPSEVATVRRSVTDTSFQGVRCWVSVHSLATTKLGEQHE